MQRENQGGGVLSMDYKIQANKVNLFYGQAQALKQISLNVEPNTVVALIGPSGCGDRKSVV
jgi:phosphate transport system ATP-binding protein